MKFKQTALRVAMTAVIGAVAMTSQMSANATGLVAGDYLSIDAGVPVISSSGNQTNVSSGSFFGMDFNGNSKISGTEKTAIPTGPGFTIGQAASTVAPIAGVQYGTKADTPAGPGPVDGTWAFNSGFGTDWFNAANGTGPSAVGTNGINFNAWTVAWNTLSSIPMTGGAWNPLNCGGALGCSAGATFANGNAYIVVNPNNTYQIDYSATVPAGDPSGFGGTQYFLRLTGTVTAPPPAVPVPAAVWLFGSGLLGLVGVARRRKSA